MAQPEISPAFLAGWEAQKRMASIFEQDNEQADNFLQAAWDEYCGTSTPAPHPLSADAFVDDWNRMVATVSVIAERYNLRKPDMVFHPEWLRSMRSRSGQHISGTLVHMGVRVKFATWQQVDALKEM